MNSKIGLTIFHEAEYNPPLTVMDKAYTSNGAQTYGFTFRYGSSSFGVGKGDTYYLSVTHEGKVSVGVQVNRATMPTWYAV